MSDVERDTDESSTVQWGRTRIDYAIRRSPRRKTVAVAVDPIEGVLLTAPTGVPIARLDQVVRDKARWITERLHHVGQLEPQGPRREFVSGESLLYLGRHHRLVVRALRGHELELPPLRLDHGKFVVHVPASLNADARASSIAASLTAWFRARAEARLGQRVQAWAEQIGVAPAGVLIREQNKRWASCDSQGVLRFNWRIIQAPPSLIDYVIAHELVHLEHADHTPAFWARLGQVMPDYDARKEQLRRLGPQLWW